jgi:hypothetical protein
MSLYSELPVYKATYDLLLAIFRFTKDFGKEYKYTVGESLKKETIEKNQRNANSKQAPARFLLRWIVLFVKRMFYLRRNVLVKSGPIACLQNVMCNCKTIPKMTRQFLFLLILTFGLSCNSCRQESSTEQKVIETARTEIKGKDNIRFDFSAERMKTSKETIEIKASLFNDNADTVYFLSSSCFGEQYSLCYDTAKFELTPFVLCNASFPRIMKIAPNGQYDFQAHFRCFSKETKIKLGFDFYTVDKSFDMDKITLTDIHGRQKKAQTIIWADEKTIK